MIDPDQTSFLREGRIHPSFQRKLIADQCRKWFGDKGETMILSSSRKIETAIVQSRSSMNDCGSVPDNVCDAVTLSLFEPPVMGRTAF